MIEKARGHGDLSADVKDRERNFPAHGDQPKREHHSGSEQHCRRNTYHGSEEHTQGRPSKCGSSVKMDLRSENQRDLARENVAENSSSHTRDNAKKYGDGRREIE